MKIADIRPLIGYCVLKEVANQSMLHLPDNAKAASRKWVIIAVSKFKIIEGKPYDPDVFKGDVVRFASPHVQMAPLNCEDGQVALCQLNDIAAVVGHMPVEEAIASNEPRRQVLNVVQG